MPTRNPMTVQRAADVLTSRGQGPGEVAVFQGRASMGTGVCCSKKRRPGSSERSRRSDHTAGRSKKRACPSAGGGGRGIGRGAAHAQPSRDVAVRTDVVAKYTATPFARRPAAPSAPPAQRCAGVPPPVSLVTDAAHRLLRRGVRCELVQHLAHLPEPSCRLMGAGAAWTAQVAEVQAASMARWIGRAGQPSRIDNHAITGRGLKLSGRTSGLVVSRRV